MLHRTLQIRRSMAVAATSGVLIFGGLSGAGLSLWARRGSSLSQLSVSLTRRLGTRQNT